jgi:hypothetical protein
VPEINIKESTLERENKFGDTWATRSTSKF